VFLKKFLKFLVSLALVTHAGRAGAQVLTFDEMTPTDATILGTVVCADSTGFRFFSDHFHVIGGNFLTDFSSNGTSYIGYESGRGFPFTMARVGAGTFSLQALDVSEFYSPAQLDRPNAQTLALTGYQQGGGIVTHTMTLDGIHDGPGGAPDFEHFVLPDTFVNLASVVFTGLRAGGLDGGVSVDNIQYQTSVPETLAPCVATPLPSTTPAVSILRPVAGYVAGTVAVEATVANFTATNVRFLLDGVALGPALTATPYLASWDTTGIVDGPHIVTVEARDAANTLLTSTVTVTVRNQPVAGGPAAFLEFDGVDDYMLAPDAPGLSFGDGTTDTSLTMEMWLRPDSMGRHQLIGKWGESTNQEYQLYLGGGGIRIDLRDQSTRGTASAFLADNVSALIGTWHHLAVTYDGRGGANAAQGLTIYIDGVAAAVYRTTDATYVAMENLAEPLQVGREGPAWHLYDGGLDDLRLWGVARTQSQIQAAMTTELSGAEPGLRAYWKFNEGSGPTATDSTGSAYVATLNGPAWTPGGPLGSAEPDTTPPTISNIVTSGITDTQVTIGYQTNESATAWVSYTAGTACPCIDAYSAAPGTTHSVTLTALAPDTLYRYLVHATDAVGNAQVTGTQTVHTLLPLPDTQPPVVTPVRPLGGSVLGTIALEATATDNAGVASVQVQVDGVNLGTADTVAPYLVSWNTTSVSDGPHTLTFIARDAANNHGTATVFVTVQNTPLATTPHFLEFDGVDDYALATDANNLSFGNGTTDTPLTMELWFRPDAMGRHQLIGKWGESTNQEFQLYLAGGGIRIDLRDQSTRGTASAFLVNNASALISSWHHLAVTYDGRGGANAAQGLTIYIDGVAAPVYRTTDATYVAMENLAEPLQIGREGPAWRMYDGGLDDLRLWSVARTQAQIQAAMTSELSGTEPGLRVYWKFNESSGTTSENAAPAGQVVTLFNTPTWVGGGPLGPAVVDTTPPTIFGLVTSGVTDTQATVSFQTSEATTAVVAYTAGTACPCTNVFSFVPGTTHSITLTALAPDTLYRFDVQATDAAGNPQTSGAQIVRTLLPLPDMQAPVVTPVRPLGGTVLGAVVSASPASRYRSMG
jgi:hypothetical protein